MSSNSDSEVLTYNSGFGTFCLKSEFEILSAGLEYGILISDLEVRIFSLKSGQLVEKTCWDIRTFVLNYTDPSQVPKPEAQSDG